MYVIKRDDGGYVMSYNSDFDMLEIIFDKGAARIFDTLGEAQNARADLSEIAPLRTFTIEKI